MVNIKFSVKGQIRKKTPALCAGVIALKYAAFAALYLRAAANIKPP